MDDSGLKNAGSTWFYPNKATVDTAYIKDYEATYKEALENVEGFWERQARTLEWFAPWEKTLDQSNAPFYKWFVGGKTNIMVNALDRHVKTWRKNKVALIWEGEPGDQR